MIEIAIDEETKTVQFKGPVNFEKAQLIVQCLMDGFGWSRQDVNLDHVCSGPSVEPCVPIPVPGADDYWKQKTVVL